MTAQEQTPQTQTQVQKTQSLISSGEAIREIKNFLKGWKPTTKVEVVKMLSFLSVVNNDTTIKNIKSDCYNFLSARCAECENAIDPESGLEVVRVEVNKKVVEETIEMVQKKELIKLLQLELKELEDKAAVLYTNTNIYYKAKL